MSSSNLINLMTLIWNLSLNFDVAFCNWLDKFFPPTDSSLKRLKFDTAKFWVQVHKLPVRCMVTKTAENLCNVVGRVIHSYDRIETECGDFM